MHTAPVLHLRLAFTSVMHAILHFILPCLVALQLLMCHAMIRAWHAGDPWTIKSAVCMHEEDAGILWCVSCPFGCALHSTLIIRRASLHRMSTSFLANVTSDSLAHSVVWERMCHGRISNE